ncbi:MAG: rhodanese-like domain-containing protein [Chthoniobacteraceae bacterium]
MNIIRHSVLLFIAGSSLFAENIPNPLIDYSKFSQIVNDSEQERQSHRLTEAQFLAAMQEKGVVILDARSAARYAQRHVRGAVSLPFTDFTAETLAGVIPAKATKVLIYCNNNFKGDPVSFASKAPAASLNLSTYTSLKAYGYSNIYELGPLLEVQKTSIPFAGSLVH